MLPGPFFLVQHITARILCRLWVPHDIPQALQQLCGRPQLLHQLHGEQTWLAPVLHVSRKVGGRWCNPVQPRLVLLWPFTVTRIVAYAVEKLPACVCANDFSLAEL